MSISQSSVVAVTGAASGIGRALAVRLASEKVRGLALSDRNEVGLRETAALLSGAGLTVSTHLVDTSKLADIERFRDEAVAAHGGVTHLINNAGVALVGSFEEVSLEDFDWLMSINFQGVVYGCKVFLPELRRHPVAHIVNISSVFGMIAPPDQAAYCASKFAVRGFTESLRHELESTNVRVSCVHPGGIKTNIARSAKVGEKASATYAKRGADYFDEIARSTPEFAAETIVRGMMNGNPRILIGSDATAISLISRLFPRRYLQIIERIAGQKLSLARSEEG